MTILDFNPVESIIQSYYCFQDHALEKLYQNLLKHKKFHNKLFDSYNENIVLSVIFAQSAKNYANIKF